MNGDPGLRTVAGGAGGLAAMVLDGAPWFVLIHGLGGAKHLFLDAAGPARERGIGLAAIDLPGFGESAPLPDGEAYSLARHADAVSAALTGLGIGEHYLAVHSMSSALLPALLAADGGSIKGIALPEANLTEEDTYWSAEISSMDDAAFERYWAQLNKHAARILGFQIRGGAGPEQVAEWARCFTMMEPRAFRETAKAVLEGTCSGAIVDALARFPGPKIYLRGAESSAWNGRPVLAAIGAEYAEVADAAHYLFLDNPAAFYPLMFDRLRGLQVPGCSTP